MAIYRRSVEDLSPPSYYQPIDPSSILFLILFSLLLGSLLTIGISWLFPIRSVTDCLSTHHLIVALANKDHPIHNHLRACCQETINASVKTAVGTIQDQMDEVIETHYLDEAVVQALERGLKEVKDELAGTQQQKAGPRHKLRRVLGRLQTPSTDSDLDTTNVDDILPAVAPSSLSFSPLSSQALSPNRHDSDSDSILGSKTGQSAQ